MPLERTRDGRTGRSRGIRHGRPAPGFGAGDGNSHRRRGALHAESPCGRLHAPDSIPGLRPADAAGACGGGERPGGLRTAQLGHADRRGRGEGPDRPARGRPLRGGRGRCAGGGRARRRGAARTRSRRMDGRRENLDQRQGRHEGVRERPRAAHGTRAAHGLPPIAARRGNPADRDRPHGRRGPRRRRGGRHRLHHAPQAARGRLAGLALAAHGTERTDTSLRPRGQRLDPQRTARPQRLGLGTARLIGNGQPGGDLLHRRAETVERRIVDERRRLQRRRDTGGRLRVRRKKQPRSRILVPAPQHADDDRNLDGHDVRKRDEHREPLCGRERRKRLRGDVQLRPEDRHAGFDLQGAGRLRTPQHVAPQR